MSNTHPNSYPLPANDIPLKVRESLAPWITGFIGLGAPEASKLLRARWATILHKPLQTLRDTLALFEVREIVNTGDGGLIKAVRPNTEDDSVGNCFYLPAPLNLDVLTSQLEAASLSHNATMREFMVYFAGLAEDTTVTGNFVYSESPWPLFTDSWRDYLEDDEEFDKWKGSLMLFHARNGSHVLVHTSGKVAWWVIQEHLISEIAVSFDEFLLQFNDHIKLARPYDPYG